MTLDEYSGLDEINGIDLTIKDKQCPLCEERLYYKTLLHLCSNHSDGLGRRDIFECPECGYYKFIDNHEEELPWTIVCECGDDDD